MMFVLSHTACTKICQITTFWCKDMRLPLFPTHHKQQCHHDIVSSDNEWETISSNTRRTCVLTQTKKALMQCNCIAEVCHQGLGLKADTYTDCPEEDSTWAMRENVLKMITSSWTYESQRKQVSRKLIQSLRAYSSSTLSRAMRDERGRQADGQHRQQFSPAANQCSPVTSVPYTKPLDYFVKMSYFKAH